MINELQKQLLETFRCLPKRRSLKLAAGVVLLALFCGCEDQDSSDVDEQLWGNESHTEIFDGKEWLDSSIADHKLSEENLILRPNEQIVIRDGKKFILYEKTEEQKSLGDFSFMEGFEEILYRGDYRVAQEIDGQLIIEGDIVVTEEDIDCRFIPGTDYCITPYGCRVQGRDYWWPNGRVPFEINTSAAGFSAVQAQAILDAMNDWEVATNGGLDFVPRNGESRYVRFELAKKLCASPVGRTTGAGTVSLANWCLTSYGVHHEIGHSLGLFHENTRKDAEGLFIQTNWSEIRGCPNTATSYADCFSPGNTTACTGPKDCSKVKCTAAEQTAYNAAWNSCGCSGLTADDCYRAHNYFTDSSRSDIYNYDYDSIMHYPARGGFSKWGNDILTVLQPTLYNIGQSDHFSKIDVATMRAMYPIVEARQIVFNNSGEQVVCKLKGRERDVANFYSLDTNLPVDSVLYSLGALPHQRIYHNSLDTEGLSPGDYLINRCDVLSKFWSKNYDYPNTTKKASFSDYYTPFSATPFLNMKPGVEVYSLGEPRTVKVLSAGLIPVLI